MPHRCVIYIPQNTCIAIGVPIRQQQTLVLRDCYTYRRGAYALLVSDIRALPEPQGVKRATVQGFTLFLCLDFTI